MWSSADQLSHYESSFGFQRPTLSLFVKTNDSSRQLVVCCRREETIKSVCKTIANIYFRTFMAEAGCDDSDEDFDCDYYYENFENYSVAVDHLEFNGYVLPALHKIGDLLENKATVTARIVLTGKETPKATKLKTKTKKEIKEKKPKVKKEPKEKKPRESKSRKRSESRETLETPKKKVKTDKKKKQQDLDSEIESMEEEKLDVLDDGSEIEEMRVKPKAASPAKKKPSVTKKPEQDNKNQKKESVTKQKPKQAKEQITIHDSSDEEPSKAAILKGLDEKIFGASGANSSSEEKIIQPNRSKPSVTKKPAEQKPVTTKAVPAPAKLQPSKTAILEGMNEKLFSASSANSSSEEKIIQPNRSKPSVTQKPAEQKPVIKKAEPPKLQPSKTAILEGMNEKLFGESEEEAPVNKPNSVVTKKPAAATTTQDTKMQVEETKKEEKPAPTRSKIRMDSADSIEYPKKKTNVPETKKPAETKDNGAKEKLLGEESEEEVKLLAKPKVQTEVAVPVPPAAAKEKSQTMNPPQDKKQQKKNTATKDLKKKDIVNFVNQLSDDSEEVPSPLVTKKDKNGAVATKPKVDPVVVPPVVQQEEAKVAVKTVEKIKEVIELISPSTENMADISMTKSVFTVGPPSGAKIGEITAFRKLSTQELTKPIVQEESPIDFKIHELIESEEEQKAASAKKTGKKGNAKKAQANETEKGGKQGGPLQKKTQNIILENPGTSEKEPKKLDLNGNEKGKGKQAAKSGGKKKKKRSLSSSSSESETEPDTKKQQRNVNLFQ